MYRTLEACVSLVSENEEEIHLQKSLCTSAVENKGNKSESENLDENHNSSFENSSYESGSVDETSENYSSGCKKAVSTEGDVDKAATGGLALPDSKTLYFKTKKEAKLERFY